VGGGGRSGTQRLGELRKLGTRHNFLATSRGHFTRKGGSLGEVESRSAERNKISKTKKGTSEDKRKRGGTRLKVGRPSSGQRPPKLVLLALSQRNNKDKTLVTLNGGGGKRQSPPKHLIPTEGFTRNKNSKVGTVIDATGNKNKEL